MNDCPSMLSTPAPPVDIVEHFAWLREFAASAIRLHPRPLGSLPVHTSKMGGLLFWPRGVPWPVCRARDAWDLYDLSRPEKLDELKSFLGHAYELECLNAGLRREPMRQWMSRHLDEIHELSRRSRHGHCQPYLPLLQLCRPEFPELPYPPGTDLFQLLWCPNVHFAGPPAEPPGYLVFWRRMADIVDPLLQEPRLPDGVKLSECGLRAEYTTEYPVTASFEAHFRAELDQWEEGGATVYDEQLSAAPGVKLFGYPRWIGDAATPFCDCGRMMNLLVTVDGEEAGARGMAAERWLPVEERGAGGPVNSHGFSIGDPGALFLFYCPICPGPKMKAVAQCG